MDQNTLRYWISVGIRRLPILVLSTMVCAFAGFALISVLQPVYRSTATIVLKQPQIAPDLARSTVPSDTLNQVAEIQEELFLRENLFDLVDRFDIYEDNPPETDYELVDDLRQRIRIEFVKVGATQDSNGAATFSVAFDDPDPEKAAAVVGYLVSSILDANVTRRTDRADETLAFFEQEVATLGAALTEAEADILRFKNENLGALPDSLDFRYTQRSSAQERLVQLDREEAGLRNRRETLLTSSRSTGPRTQSSRDQELMELRRILEQRLSVFAPDSPSVRDIEERIAAMKRPAPAATQPAEDHLSGELELQLSEIDGRLEFIEMEKGKLSETLGELQNSIAVTPGNETELNRLMRVYESTRARYLATVQRHADASIGSQIETHLKGERLTLLEAPVVPEKPFWPKRRKIALASVVAGMALGCGIILLLEFLDGRVRRPAQLVQRLDLEPVATIPYIDAPGERTARHVRAWGLSAAWVGAFVGALVIIHFAFVPLDAAALRILHAVGVPLAG